MFTKTKGASKALKGAAALAASLMIGMVAPGVAVAQEAGTANSAAEANTPGGGALTSIDVTKKGSITIQKLQELSSTQHPTADGKTAPTFESSPKALNKINYTVSCAKVENACFQPKTNADLQLLAQVADAFKDGKQSDASITVGEKTFTWDTEGKTLPTGFKTDAEPTGAGYAKFADLTAGLYRVTESLPTTDTVTEHNRTDTTGDGTVVNKGSIAVSAPFVVMLPMTDPTNRNSWNYDISVWPKNDIISIEKSVSNNVARGVNQKQAVAQTDSTNQTTYTITADIPSYGEQAGKLGRFAIVDKMPKNLKYLSEAVANKVYICESKETPLPFCKLVGATNYALASNTQSDGVTYARMEINSDKTGQLVDARKASVGAVVKWVYNAVETNKQSTTAGEEKLPDKTDLFGASYTYKQTNKAALVHFPYGQASEYAVGTGGDPIAIAATLGSKVAGLFPASEDTDAENIAAAPMPLAITNTTYQRFTVKKYAKDGTTALTGMKFKIYVCSADEDSDGQLRATTAVPTTHTTVFPSTVVTTLSSGGVATTTSSSTTLVTSKTEEALPTLAPVTATAAAANVAGIQGGTPIVALGTTNVDGTTSSADEFVTGPDGTAYIAGLVTNPTVDGAPEDSTTNDTYCLLETQAPNGYELNPQPVKFKLDGTNAEFTVVLKNVETNAGFQLPFTGGKGIIPFIVMGILLVAAAGFWFLAGKRRKDEEENYA